MSAPPNTALQKGATVRDPSPIGFRPWNQDVFLLDGRLLLRANSSTLPSTEPPN